MNLRNFCQNQKNIFVALSVFFLIISINLSLLIVPAYAQETNIRAQTSLSPPQAYLNALQDVKKAESDEISKDLTAIVKDNTIIHWRGDRLKVATFTNYDGYKVGSLEPQSVDIWVTVVPELKNFCTEYYSTGGNLILRLEQLLGLAPSHKQSQKIVEFWVESKDLFRPTPDPEITDHEAELDFPKSNDFLIVSEEYKDWFNNRLNEFKIQLREMDPEKLPSPWTRLGYTYDWGEPKNHVGLSEFVIRKGSNIEVDSISKVNDYCQGTVLN